MQIVIFTPNGNNKPIYLSRYPKRPESALLRDAWDFLNTEQAWEVAQYYTHKTGKDWRAVCVKNQGEAERELRIMFRPQEEHAA